MRRSWREIVQGVSTSMSVCQPKGLGTSDFADGLDMLSEAGFRLIEISRRDHADPECAAAVASRGMKVWAVHGGLGGDSVSDSDAARREAVEQEMTRMEASAVFAPCPYVIHYLNRSNDPAVGERFRRSVAELAERAEALGLTLAIETVPNKPANERYPDTKEVADFARSFGSDFVGVCIDLNHSNLVEDLVQVAGNCEGVIATIHVSDNHGEKEEHLLPGQGSIDLVGALRAIAGAGYAGPLNLECHTPGPPTVDELVRLREWAEGVLRDI